MNTDKIIIRGLKAFAYHGVLEDEKNNGQEFVIDAELEGDFEEAKKTDNLEETVNYAKVCEVINRQFLKDKNDLIEKTAFDCAKEVMLSFPKIRKIKIDLHKPHAPIGLPFEDVVFEMTLAWHKVYLSIGSNMGDKEKYLNQAVDSLYDDENVRVLKVSDYIITKPVGGVEQDDFLNGALEIETLYTPEELLYAVNNIEAEAGRERKIHWGPRTLDIDILLYDDLIMNKEELIIPHIQMTKREFVLYPLSKIAPYAIHPILKETISSVYEEFLEQNGNPAGKCSGCSGCAMKSQVPIKTAEASMTSKAGRN